LPNASPATLMCSCWPFLRQIDRETPRECELHLIADNYATHKTSPDISSSHKKDGYPLPKSYKTIKRMTDARLYREAPGLSFGRLGRRVIEGDFSGGVISSDAGMLLLRQVDQRIGLSRQVAAAMHDRRDRNRVTHTLRHWVAQRLYGLAAAMKTSTITIISTTMRCCKRR